MMTYKNLPVWNPNSKMPFFCLYRPKMHKKIDPDIQKKTVELFELFKNMHRDMQLSNLHNGYTDTQGMKHRFSI